jgi:hypothetical protein
MRVLLASAVLGILLAACSGSDGVAPTQTPRLPTAVPSDTSVQPPTPSPEDPNLGKALSDLIARPDVPFEVGYSAENVGPILDRFEIHATWRQSGEQRRLDLVWGIEGGQATGRLSVQRDFNEPYLDPIGLTGEECEWGNLLENASITCSDSGGGLFHEIDGYWNSVLARPLESRVIAGRNALCYELGGNGLGPGYACLDPVTDVLLYFSRRSGAEFQAEYVIDDGTQPQIITPMPGPGDRLELSGLGLSQYIVGLIRASAP